MKPRRFRLVEEGQQLAADELLEDLRRVAQSTGRATVTKADYLAFGQHDRGTIARRFGGWRQALEAAGLSNAHLVRLSEDELIADLRRVAAHLGKPSVSQAEYTKLGKFSVQPYRVNFQNWTGALAKAGLSLSPFHRTPIGDTELFADLESMWMTLGRQPRSTEVNRPLAKYSLDTFLKRFGSWRKTLEAFVAHVNEPDDVGEGERVRQVTMAGGGPQRRETARRRRRTSRSPAARLRFLVMQRDGFRCVKCGASPATTAGVLLHVDHIQAWALGGETLVDNLQTLCEICNLGKGASPDVPCNAP